VNATPPIGSTTSVPIHHEYIVAYDAAGRAFLWRAGRDKGRYLCARWTLNADDLARVNSGIVEADRLHDRRPAHGNFSDVAAAFSFFARGPDESLESFATSLLGRIGSSLYERSHNRQ
jgi:hypothetical protein